MYRIFLIMCSVILLCSPCFSQGEYNNWHFGLFSGLSFNTGSPVEITSSQITTEENCASISDATGNLLFYTNGITVWNAADIPMPNGTDLSASYDAQQGVLIVPKPATAVIYYVFTIGLSTTGDSLELRYSIVDMSLNGGMGDVTTKNVLLDNFVTERLSAVKQRNGTDFWVVTKNKTNIFKSFPVTVGGIGSPVVSPGGVPIEMNDYTGAIRISGDGCWLVSTTRGGFGNPGLIELFRFNNLTGVISDGAVTMLEQHPYGLEISPGNTKLYVGENDTKPVYQFDLNAGSAAQVLASPVAVTGNLITFSFQAAPDGKIYFTRAISTDPEFHKSLAAIENPDETGLACNVNLTAFVSPTLFNTGALPNNFALTYTGSLTNCGTLPVTLLSFNAKKINEDAFLNWSTSSEFNSKEFQVEISTDGINFSTAGIVNAAGESSMIKKYEFIDYKFRSYNVKTVFYRLKEVDRDNQFAYSKTISLDLSSGVMPGNVYTYPNPFSKSFSIVVTTESENDKIDRIALYSVTGKIVYIKEPDLQGSQVIVLPAMPNLEKGLYILKTIIAGKPFFNKIIKN